MRGLYHMPEWEIEKWKEKFVNYINVLETKPIDEIDLTKEDLCPGNVRKVLEELGYERYDWDENGWEQDTWYYFEHKETGKRLTLFWCGYTFSLNLMLTENDEDYPQYTYTNLE